MFALPNPLGVAVQLSLTCSVSIVLVPLSFLCSAVSTIIANAHLPLLANLLDGTALAGIFFQGIYTDLTPNWYKVVGRSLLISQILAAVLRVCYLLMRCAAVCNTAAGRRPCTLNDVHSTLWQPHSVQQMCECLHALGISPSHRNGQVTRAAAVSRLFVWCVVGSFWCFQVGCCMVGSPEAWVVPHSRGAGE